MKTTKFTFTKEKYALIEKFSAEYTLSLGVEADDAIKNLVSAVIMADMYTRINEVKDVTVFRDRPKFLDWLLRRKATFHFRFESKEVLHNPPVLAPGTSTLMYSVTEM